MKKPKQMIGSDAKILVVAVSAAMRTQLIDSLGKCGYTNAEGCLEVKVLLEKLEAERFDWLIWAIDPNADGLTLGQLLRMTWVHPELRQMRVSQMLNSDRKNNTGEYYELGLMSHHVVSDFGDELIVEMQELKRLLARHQFDTCLVAANYVRKYMRSEKFPAGHVEFEKKLIGVRPGHAELLLNLAEAFLADGRKAECFVAANQAGLLDVDLKKEAEKLKAMCGAQGEPDDRFNAIGIEYAAIVDSDESVRLAIKDILHSLGVPKVVEFSDGQLAAAAIVESTPDLLLMEWRIPKVTGPLLIQRLRQAGAHEAVVVIVSSLIDKSDLPLLREMSVSDTIGKPLKKQDIIESIVWSLREMRMPSSVAMLEQKVKKYVLAGLLGEAAGAIEVFELEHGTITPPERLKYIKAELQYASGQFAEARDGAAQVLRDGGDSLSSLHLLGKCFMQLADFESAIKCFERAQRGSPLNIERLCRMAECQSELGKVDDAAAFLDQATAIDGSNTFVKETRANIALASGDIQTAKKIMGELESIENVVSFINNRAVAFSRGGKLEAGIELYRRALKSIPNSRREWALIINYNLALAHVKNNELEEALLPLKRSISSSSIIKKRAESLSAKVTKAIESGVQIKLNVSTIAGVQSLHVQENVAHHEGQGDLALAATVDEDPARTQNSLNLDVVKMVELERGDLCCYMIYHYAGERDPTLQAQLAALPPYRPRAAIKRAETYGQERIEKNESKKAAS